jgi:YfiH family protein
MQKLAFIQPNWPAPTNVHAASTVRSGGVSREPFDSLNLATHVGDDASSVAENRRLLKTALRLSAEPAWLDQIHSDVVVEASDVVAPPRADACVARSSGRACVVMTADCLPILFCNQDGDRVAATHAGWRGLAAGIIDTTVGTLGVPGHQLMAWMGPAIGPSAFEVGDEVRIAMLARDGGTAGAFVQNSRGRWQCDIYAIARRNLNQLGVTEVYGGGYCTYTDERFFSYRRDGRCGRMATLIWMD